MDVLGWIFVIGIVFFLLSIGKSKSKNKRYKRTTLRVWGEPAQKQEPTVGSRPTHQPAPQQLKQASQPNRKIASDGFRYDPDGEWPFQKRKLITATETVLFERLRQALPNHYIFTQVQLSQLVAIKKGHSFKMWFSRISQMSVDFVIADEFLNTVAAVELDDKSHYSDEDRHKADAKKDKVLTAAGIRVIRWRCEIMPSAEQIALAFPECKTALQPSQQAEREPSATMVEAIAELDSAVSQRTESIAHILPQTPSEPHQRAT
ncbi:DUF2726 domain-containing protein [Stutzerimonas stutzeri]|uniref:DUF2726 domain-containing protein n=1 Tax=Stutzerimonas stutzeri TaxID=316 RepID=UPI00210AA7C4|nr:DUF2726 domain-containing protein [Stutzerimonas stutzeri]MCQ4240507.1 DUF2726 domain-containing protein [Stutzerimonas stutzeri]